MASEITSRAKSSLKEISALAALSQLSQYIGGYIAWTKDRRAVYALAHSKAEILTKLEEMGLTTDDACIDPVGQFDQEFDYGLRLDKP